MSCDRFERSTRLLLVVTGLLSLGLAGDVGTQPASATPAQASDAEITVVSVERLEHSTHLVLEIHNPTDQDLRLAMGDRSYGAFDVTVQNIRHNDLSGLRLLDEAAQVEYHSLRNLEERVCICSELPLIEPGDTLRGWWRSTPLADSVDVVTVLGADGEVLASDIEVTR